MPALTLSVANLTKSLTIQTADVQRWLDAYKARFSLPPTATNEQVFDMFATWLLIDVANASVLTYEKEKAGQDAATAVPPIPLTPV